MGESTDTKRAMQDLSDAAEVLGEEILFVLSKGDYEGLGDQAKYILKEVLPRFVLEFVEANKHYGGKNPNVLGPAGQFADIWRKINPLYRALWDGVELTRESPERICLDLIGHCLLTIAMLDKGVPRRGLGPTSLGGDL